MGDKDIQNNNNTIYAMALASSLPLWHQNYTAEKTTKENGDFKKFTTFSTCPKWHSETVYLRMQGETWSWKKPSSKFWE